MSLKKNSLKSRDPLANFPVRTKKKIPLCDITINLQVGKRKQAKSLGKAYLVVRRSSYSSPVYGNGFHTRPTTHIQTVDYDFDLMVKKGKKTECIGCFTTRIDQKGRACITSSGIEEERYLGIGLGKKAYEAIAGFHKVLESDPNGSTSEEARRVWLSMKAKRVSNRRRFQVVSNRRIRLERVR